MEINNIIVNELDKKIPNINSKDNYWILSEDYRELCACSRCAYPQSIKLASDICPRCKAKMKNIILKEKTYENK